MIKTEFETLGRDAREAMIQWVRRCGADGVAVSINGASFRFGLDQIDGKSSVLDFWAAQDFLGMRPAYRDERGDLREAPAGALFGHDDRSAECWIRLAGEYDTVVRRNHMGRWSVWRGGLGGGRSFGTAPEAWVSALVIQAESEAS